MATINHSFTIDSTNSITNVKSFSKSPVSQFHEVRTLLLLAAFSTCNHYIPLLIQPSWSFSLKGKNRDHSNCSDNGPNQMMKPANTNTNKNNKIKKYTKSNLPSKICCVCKRPFEFIAAFFLSFRLQLPF
jgi:hypothetical protein